MIKNFGASYATLDLSLPLYSDNFSHYPNSQRERARFTRGDAPPPLSLLSGLSPVAQMDDPELVRELAEEESLVDLQEIEL